MDKWTSRIMDIAIARKYSKLKRSPGEPYKYIGYPEISCYTQFLRLL